MTKTFAEKRSQVLDAVVGCIRGLQSISACVYRGVEPRSDQLPYIVVYDADEDTRSEDHTDVHQDKNDSVLWMWINISVEAQDDLDDEFDELKERLHPVVCEITQRIEQTLHTRDSVLNRYIKDIEMTQWEYGGSIDKEKLVIGNVFLMFEIELRHR